MAANEQQHKETREPSHHARRPMNAFLIFCKRHRGSVRSGFPHLENRAVTRVLGEWWATLQPDQKRSYTNLAQEYKSAFLSANPDFKWYKLPAPPLRTLNTRPTNKKLESTVSIQPLGFMKSEYESSHTVNVDIRNNEAIQPGKLADETQIGGLSSLFTPQKLQLSEDRITDNDTNISVRDSNVPKPPKKRYMDQTSSTEYNLDCKVDLFNEKKTRRFDLDNNNKQHLQNANNGGCMSFLAESNNPIEGNTFRTERSCKGLRYQKFLAEQMRSSGSISHRSKQKRTTEYYGSDEHITERRHSISSNISEKTDSISSEGGNSIRSELEHLVESAEGNMEASKPEETETGMTNMEAKIDFRPWALRKRYRAEDFNLEKKIEALPSLSLEEFQEKKKQQRNKKKKITQKVSVTSSSKKSQCNTSSSYSNTVNHKRAQCSANGPLEKDDNRTQLVGSQKRKARKRSITRNTGASSQNGSNEAWCATPDLEALACLAAVAANRTKLTKNSS